MFFGKLIIIPEMFPNRIRVGIVRYFYAILCTMKSVRTIRLFIKKTMSFFSHKTGFIHVFVFIRNNDIYWLDYNVRSKSAHSFTLKFEEFISENQNIIIYNI